MKIKPGIYTHYKGNEYQVIDVATHSETEELLVIYRTLYGNYDLWVRPFDMFTDSITINNQEMPRFRWPRDANA